MNQVEVPMKCVSQETGVIHHWFYREYGKMTLIRDKVSCTMCKALMNLATEQNMISPTVHLKAQIMGAQRHYEAYTEHQELVSCPWCRSAMNDRTPVHFQKVYEESQDSGYYKAYLGASKGYEYGVAYCRVTCVLCRCIFLTKHHQEARVTIEAQFKLLAQMFVMVENKAHEYYLQGKKLHHSGIEMLCDAWRINPTGRKIMDALIEQSTKVKWEDDKKEYLLAVFSVDEAENPDGSLIVEGP